MTGPVVILGCLLSDAFHRQRDAVAATVHLKNLYLDVLMKMYHIVWVFHVFIG